jgi:hypothetical protein
MNWPARNGVSYEVLGKTELANDWEAVAIVTGGFPRVAWFGRVNEPYRFFTVRELVP